MRRRMNDRVHQDEVMRHHGLPLLENYHSKWTAEQTAAMEAATTDDHGVQYDAIGLCELVSEASRMNEYSEVLSTPNNSPKHEPRNADTCTSDQQPPKWYAPCVHGPGCPVPHLMTVCQAMHATSRARGVHHARNIFTRNRSPMAGRTAANRGRSPSVET